MRTILIYFLLLLGNVLYGYSAPLELDFSKHADGVPLKDDDVDRLHEAAKLANQQIEAMHKVAQDYKDPAHKKILLNTFGKNYEKHIDVIQEHVKQLKAGTIDVANARDPSLKETTVAVTKGKGVRFSGKYHDEHHTDEDRAGTLIHEASHALFKTKDFFKNDNKGNLEKISRKQAKEIEAAQEEKNAQARAGKITLDEAKDGDSVMSGYLKDQHYKELRDHPNSKMHENADAWKAFGHHALTGVPHPKLSSTNNLKRLHQDEDSKNVSPGPSKRQKHSPEPSPSGSSKKETHSAEQPKQRKSSPARSASGSSKKQKGSPAPPKSRPSRKRGKPRASSPSPKGKQRLSSPVNSRPARPKRKQSPPPVTRGGSSPKGKNR